MNISNGSNSPPLPPPRFDKIIMFNKIVAIRTGPCKGQNPLGGELPFSEFIPNFVQLFFRIFTITSISWGKPLLGFSVPIADNILTNYLDLPLKNNQLRQKTNLIEEIVSRGGEVSSAKLNKLFVSCIPL